MADKRDNGPQLAKLVPLHVAGDAKVSRRRGRPQKLEAKPGLSDLAYYQALSEEKLKSISADEVVRAVESRVDALEVLRRVKVAIAKEAASLEFQRKEGEKRGRDGSQTSSRRIDALVKVANLELEMARLSASVLDLRSEPVQRLFEMFVEEIRDAALEVLDPKSFDLLFNKLEARLTGWEDKAEARLR